MIDNKDLGIEQFLEGKSDKKYVVAIECDYYSNLASVIVHDPEKGKFIEKMKYSPFLFMKELPQEIKATFYKNDQSYKMKAMTENGITIKKVRTTDKNNINLERLSSGYKYLVSTNKSFGDIVKFFRNGGLDIYKHGGLFVRQTPQEQFMIQTGVRLFKGYEFYNDIHKAVFDIETTGLDGNKERCFLIGLSDNKGYEKIFEVTKPDDDESELKVILDFFHELNEMKPAILSGYNSENFDFDFLLKRLAKLGYDFNNIKLGLDGTSSIKRKEGATIKYGSETESYTQTIVWGYNIIDIYHSVRRAKAINSEIKEAGLKYITKYSDAAKPDRMYIDNGFNIYKFWRDNNLFIINKENNEYVQIPDILQDEVSSKLNNILLEGSDCTVNSSELNSFLKEHPDKIDFIYGKEIIRQYLLDDLWETKQVDLIFNESTFMVSKWLPSIFTRSATIGGSGSWNMIMITWSYENNIAIPYAIKKRAFVGGISRTFRLGFSKGILKGDYAGLYPSIQLEDNVFPIYDVDSVLYRLLKYFKETRDIYKQLAKVEPDLKKRKFYDTKQLPLKIFNNSNFGANGSEFFYWSDMDIAERITCSGRQYLRKMIKFFYEFDFKPVVCDSVTYDTPVYVLDENENVDILPISQLFNENSSDKSEDNLRDFSKKPYKILTKNGFKNILYTYKHFTTKNIHTLTTKDRRIDVTEDHSVYSHGIEVQPKNLVKGDKLDVYNIPFIENNNLKTYNNIELNEDIAWLYGMFLGDGSAISTIKNKKYFSKRKNEYIIYNHKGRYDWKISNQNLELLDRTKNILKKEFNKDSILKDHSESSNVHNIVVYGKEFIQYFTNNFYTSYREKKLPIEILNCNDKKILTSFINGFYAAEGDDFDIEGCEHVDQKSKVAFAGISYILNKLGQEYRITLRNDKREITTYRFPRKFGKTKPKTKMSSDHVWFNRDNGSITDYVYDISTEDGTFVAGIGGVLCHNTDGSNFNTPVFITKDLNTLEPLLEPIKIEDVKFVNKNGAEYTGLEAFFEKFNQDYLSAKYMKVDNDGEWVSGLNLSRKNYVSFEVTEKNGKIKEKMKLVGNSIKSSNLPKYAENFLKVGLDHVVKDKPKDFIELYYDLITKIFYRQIPTLEIASKAKVKRSLKDYCQQVYIPYIIKTIFLYENIDMEKEIVKQFKNKKSKFFERELLSLTHEEDGEIKNIINVEFFDSFKKELEKVNKNKKFDKLPLNKIQDKFSFIIDNDYNKNQELPEFLGDKDFNLLFKNDFINAVYDVCNNITNVTEFLRFHKQLKKYLAIQGNKNGAVMPRQTFMDLLIDNKAHINLGDTVYYINVGEKRTNSDSGLNKEGNLFVHLLNNKGELYGVADEDKSKVLYNVDKYIDDINTKIEALLVVFKESVKNTLLITNPVDRQYYTDDDLQLVSWDYNTYPYDKMEDIDDLYQDTKNVALFKMEDREVRFWNKIGIDPKIIFDGFTTDKEKIDKNPYFDKYIKVRDKLKQYDINLKYIKGRYEEGDIVLIEENNKFYLSVYQNNQFIKDREV